MDANIAIFRLRPNFSTILFHNSNQSNALTFFIMIKTLLFTALAVVVGLVIYDKVVAKAINKAA